MIRFPFLEEAGVSAALMTDRHDGDFADGGDSLVRLCAELGLKPDGVTTLKQVHGSDVYEVGEIPQSGEGDGLITVSGDHAIAIRIADCVPVFLVDPTKSVGALLHAGWRGTLDGIVKHGVEQLREIRGCRPEDILAVIGPSAGPERYEVSEELARRFAQAGLAAEGRHVNLWESNALQLRRAAILSENIHISGHCTITEQRFFSHRRAAEKGRNLALLAL